MIKIKRGRGSDHPSFKGHGFITCTFFSNIKRHAEERGIRFNITIKDVNDLYIKQDKKCALTGINLNFSPLTRESKGTASIDRKSSKGGYTKRNIQFVHKKINMMKGRLTDKEFITWAKLIVDHHQKQLIKESQMPALI